MINLRDLEAFMKHDYYGRRQEGKDANNSLAFLGAVTVAIGSKMIWDGVGKNWADRVAMRAGRGWLK